MKELKWKHQRREQFSELKAQIKKKKLLWYK